jgi:hypothetical protein
MDPWKPDPDLHKSLCAELGLCVYVYQSIEASLKTLLPHFVVTGTDTHAPGEGFENWRVFLDSKLTLGPMMERLKERSSFGGSEEADRELRRLVDYRNEVVHHFVGQPFSRLSSEDDYKAAFEFLKIRRLAALPMFNLLQELLVLFTSVWTEQVGQSKQGAA